VGARGEAVVPAGARVELADEVEQARGGGFEVCGELGDLVARRSVSAIDSGVGMTWSGPISMAKSSLLGRLYPWISDPPPRLKDAR